MFCDTIILHKLDYQFIIKIQRLHISTYQFHLQASSKIYYKDLSFCLLFSIEICLMNTQHPKCYFYHLVYLFMGSTPPPILCTMGVNSGVERPALHSPLSNIQFSGNWKCNVTPTCDCGVQRQFYLLFIYLFIHSFIRGLFKESADNSADKFRFPILADNLSWPISPHRNVWTDKRTD
jgi:hypothetical protein